MMAKIMTGIMECLFMVMILALSILGTLAMGL